MNAHSELTEEQMELISPSEIWDYSTAPTLPKDVAQADRHMAAAERIRLRHARMASVFRAEIERLDAALAEQEEAAAKLLNWHGGAVERWHRAAFRAGEVGKTVKLPHGESKLRAAQPEIEIFDEDAFRAFAEGNDLLNPAKEPTPALAKLRKLLKKTEGVEPGTEVPLVTAAGEGVPGVRAKTVQDTHRMEPLS